MVMAGSILWGIHATVCCYAVNDQNTLLHSHSVNVSWGKSGDMLPSSPSSTFNSSLWSGSDTIINVESRSDLDIL